MKPLVNSKAANVLAAASILLNNEGESPPKSPEVPDSDTIALISLAMYCTGVPIGGVSRVERVISRRLEDSKLANTRCGGIVLLIMKVA